MAKEWITATDGEGLKFKHETLLNYGLNRWGIIWTNQKLCPQWI